MVSKINLIIRWENDNFFEMKSKKDDEETQTIIRMDENAHLNNLWGSVTKICSSYMDKILGQIGDEMKEGG